MKAGEVMLAFRLARRELRGGLRGFRIFLASLALGVAAIAAVGTVNHAVMGGLAADARVLLGGDVELRLAQRHLSEAEARYISDATAAMSTVTEFRAMARPVDNTERRTVVEIKAVDATYPLVGSLDLRPPSAADEILSQRNGQWGIVVEPQLLNKLGVDIDDAIRIGDASFLIRGTIVREPDRVASVVSFGPRAMVSAAALPSTGLLQPGSIVRHNTRVVLDQGTSAEDWIATANERFPSAGWQVRDAAGAAPGVRRFVDRFSMFLTFAGLAALLIGGLGVANAVHHHLDGKVTTIATMKCLGAPGPMVFATYLIEILILAVSGIGLGLALGATFPILALQLVGDILPVPIEMGIYPAPLAKATTLGFLTAITFALWPLGRVRNVPAGNLFRQAALGPAGRPNIRYVTAAGFCAVLLAVLTILTTHDRLFGACFVGGAILTLLILRAGASLATRVAKRLPRPRNAVVRLALMNLHRAGAPTPQVMMSLGTGLTVLIAIGLVDSNLRLQIGERLPDVVPAVFFIDIQDEQAPTFDAIVSDVSGVTGIERVPSVRGSIQRIAGVPVARAVIAPEAQWAVNGDRALTYAASPPEDAKIVAGAWWPPDYAGPPLVSLDASLAEGFGVTVGDTLTLNILGREIEATIASLRDIDWRAIPFNFALILAPGLLERAPHTHIAAVYAPAQSEDLIERRVTDRFANVTAIRTREALEAVNNIIGRIGWGVRAAASVTIVAGALVLAGAIAAERHRRTYETVVFKVLGASRRRITHLYAVEYGLLGLTTALAATAIGTTIGWAVTVLIMDFEWHFDPTVVATTTLVCVTLTLAVGFVGTWRHLGQKAAPFLRNE